MLLMRSNRPLISLASGRPTWSAASLMKRSCIDLHVGDCLEVMLERLQEGGSSHEAVEALTDGIKPTSLQFLGISRGFHHVEHDLGLLVGLLEEVGPELGQRIGCAGCFVVVAGHRQAPILGRVVAAGLAECELCGLTTPLSLDLDLLNQVTASRQPGRYLRRRRCRGWRCRACRRCP